MPIPVDKKPKERCKFYPACTKFECEFFHPLSSCKAFPNCKFAEKCLYIHPKCKYDVSCTNNGCNYSHTRISTNAPPLSSHVVPVQNYKSINPVRSSGGSVDSTMMCKYYPHCTNNTCNFYHPKPCKFGWNCLNKLECNFYHPDVVQVRDKFKWVASAV
ncbi:ZC3H14.2 family protein [Megaselia abdita]